MLHYAVRQLVGSPGFTLVAVAGLRSASAPQPDPRRVLVSAIRRGAATAAVFSDLALFTGNAFTLTRDGDPEHGIGLHASVALSPALGLQPIIGRNFSPDDWPSAGVD